MPMSTSRPPRGRGDLGEADVDAGTGRRAARRVLDERDERSEQQARVSRGLERADGMRPPGFHGGSTATDPRRGSRDDIVQER